MTQKAGLEPPALCSTTAMAARRSPEIQRRTGDGPRRESRAVHGQTWAVMYSEIRVCASERPSAGSV